LVAYLLVSAEVFLATAVHGTFRMSCAGIGPTELRIVLAAGALALVTDPSIDLGRYGRVRLFDVGGAGAIVGRVVAFLVGVVRNVRALNGLEPRPRPRANGRRREVDAGSVPASMAQS